MLTEFNYNFSESTLSFKRCRVASLLILLFSLICFHSCSYGVSKKKHVDDNVLKSVIKTKRISSNHYSEIVTDTLGNSYVASFKKENDNQDYVQIVKMDQNGSVIWIKGGSYLGRSTALSLSNKGNIIVAGWVEDILDFDGFRIEAEDDAKVFIVELDHDGKCLKMNTLKSDGVFNIRSNKSGQILISGACNSDSEFGKIPMNFQENVCKRFIGILDDELNFVWVKSVDFQIVRIKNYDDDFFVSGKFNTKMSIDSFSLFTSSDMDEDGYVFKMNNYGSVQWIHQFGLKKAPLHYARSNESGVDISFTKHGDVLVSAIINADSLKDENSLHVYKYNQEGKKMVDFALKEQISNTVSTINADVNDNIWVTGNQSIIDSNTTNSSHKTQAFVSHYNSEFSLMDEVEIVNGKNTIFRSSYLQDSFIRYSGHFQEYLKIEKDSLINAGEHEMFFYKRKIN